MSPYQNLWRVIGSLQDEELLAAAKQAEDLSKVMTVTAMTVTALTVLSKALLIREKMFFPITTLTNKICVKWKVL